LRVSVIIPAAGASQRYLDSGATLPKLAEVIGHRTVLAHAVVAFLQRADIAEVIVPCSDEKHVRRLLGELALDPRVRFAPGGACRAESVLSALRLCSPCDLVAVHDGARPVVSQRLISAVLSHAAATGPTAPALPVHLTIKQAAATTLPAEVERTLPRSTLYALQTPQAMPRDALLHALTHAPIPLRDITDDLQALELQHQKTWLIAGEDSNLKITHAADLDLARRLLAPPPPTP
jgi:2-C-methyl-D-erythritol 4-phosphate cytidylyltransferase